MEKNNFVIKKMKIRKGKGRWNLGYERGGYKKKKEKEKLMDDVRSLKADVM